MHDTLASLVERALTGNRRPLEFYLRDHSRLPGPRANLELADDVSHLLAAAIPKYPDKVHEILDRFANGDREMVAGNTPSEFIMLCGITAFGACAAACPEWRIETFSLLKHYACSSHWRVREGVVIAYQYLLTGDAPGTIEQLTVLATDGNFLQQRAAAASIAEPPLLYAADIKAAALRLQCQVLDRIRNVPPADRKHEDFRALRRALGYTLSIVTAASPEEGFAVMLECASWHDSDIVWILRENLKKKRLAKFVQQVEAVSRMLP